MSYSCKRCGYRSAFKHHLQNHMKRAYMCKPILSDCEPSITYEHTICDSENVSKSARSTPLF